MILEIPDETASSLPGAGGERGAESRAVLECFAVEAYRRGILSVRQVGDLLQHPSRWDTEDFLATHDAWPGMTLQDAVEDARALNGLLGAKAISGRRLPSLRQLGTKRRHPAWNKPIEQEETER